MAKSDFMKLMSDEVERIDSSDTAKRNELIIEGYTNDSCPKAIVKGNECTVFNSNDYLGLRHHKALKEAEQNVSERFGTGPGAVRFISGTLKVHRDLENALAKFHDRDDAIVFSSAFAANLATVFCLAKGQSKASLINSDVLIVSDELNHRSIIDGIRLSNLPPEQKAIFRHMDYTDLERVLNDNLSKYGRVLVVTDGVFSMLGEYQDLKQLRAVIDKYDSRYAEGILLVVDDCHGVGACGNTGRGCEEIFKTKADVLVGTLGKAFGADGGYVAGDKVIVDYLRESAATYIYSNSISPGTAGAALEAVTLLDKPEGKAILDKLKKNITYFKDLVTKSGLILAAESTHAIQPLLIGDSAKTKILKEKMFEAGYIITNINYPIVPQGRDEIRVQISANHTRELIESFLRDFLLI